MRSWPKGPLRSLSTIELFVMSAKDKVLREARMEDHHLPSGNAFYYGCCSMFCVGRSRVTLVKAIKKY